MWLLEADTFRLLEQAYKAGTRPTAAESAEFFEALDTDDARGGARIMSVAGDTARIEVAGVLTPKPDLWALLFGGANTSYAEINAALATAEADPDVARIELAIDSPGGMIPGLFDTLGRLQEAKKPIEAVISNMGASAAYALAAQADRIVAANKAARIGSIGILARFLADDGLVSVTSTEAPEKDPDPTTDEGQAIIRRQLDDMHALFVEAIATGRQAATGDEFSAERVNKTFGRGATYLAAEAKKSGMIDAVGANAVSLDDDTSETANNQAAESADNSKEGENKRMDVKQFQAEHPEAYAQAVEAGVTKERDRVVAHLTLGAQSGATETATNAIKNGDELTAALQAEYMAAAMKSSAVETAQTETDENNGEVDNSEGDPQASADRAFMAAFDGAMGATPAESEA